MLRWNSSAAGIFTNKISLNYSQCRNLDVFRHKILPRNSIKYDLPRFDTGSHPPYLCGHLMDINDARYAIPLADPSISEINHVI